MIQVDLGPCVKAFQSGKRLIRGGAGLVAIGRGTILDSTLLDNEGGGAGVDILTTQPPRLRNSTYTRASLVIPGDGGFDAGAPWGVCARLTTHGARPLVAPSRVRWESE